MDYVLSGAAPFIEDPAKAKPGQTSIKSKTILDVSITNTTPKRIFPATFTFNVLGLYVESSKACQHIGDLDMRTSFTGVPAGYCVLNIDKGHTTAKNAATGLKPDTKTVPMPTNDEVTVDGVPETDAASLIAALSKPDISLIWVESLPDINTQMSTSSKTWPTLLAKSPESCIAGDTHPTSGPNGLFYVLPPSKSPC